MDMKGKGRGGGGGDGYNMGRSSGQLANTGNPRARANLRKGYSGFSQTKVICPAEMNCLLKRVLE